MNSIRPDEDMPFKRRAVRRLDNYSIVACVNLVNALIDKDLCLVLDVIVQYLEHHLTIKERDGIAMPGTALGLVPSSRSHGSTYLSCIE